MIKLRTMVLGTMLVAGAALFAPKPAKADVSISIGSPRGGVGFYAGPSRYDYGYYEPRYVAPVRVYYPPASYYRPRYYDRGYDYHRGHHHHHHRDYCR